MDELERSLAIQEIQRLKARYFRAADTKDMDLMRTVLADECILDFAGACRDPQSGEDLLAGVTEGAIVGRDEAIARFSQGTGLVTVHHGHTCEIDLDGPETATGVWAMTDHLYFSPGGPVQKLTGHGHYFESYEKRDGQWWIKSLRLTRLRVETAGW